MSIENFRNDQPGWSFGIAYAERSLILCLWKWECVVSW